MARLPERLTSLVINTYTVIKTAKKIYIHKYDNIQSVL